MNNIQIYFNPLDSKSVEHYSVPVGTPLIDFLQEEFPDGFAGMLHVLVGIEPLELEDLDYEIKKGERVTMLVMPAFAGFGALIAQTLISAAIATAIGFVINLIFRPSTPGISNDGEESPVYSLSPTRNRARLGEPISAHYGSVVYPPDYAAAPYQFFYEGSNDMFIDELLCLGQGDFSVEDVYIGDTPVLAMEPGTVRYWLFDSTEHSTFKQIENQVWTDVQDTDLPWPFRENVYTAPEVDGFQFNGDRSNQVLTPQSIDGTAVAGSYDPVTDTYVQGEINNITYVPPDETEEGLNPTVGNLRSGDVIDLQNTVSNNITFTIDSIVYSDDGLTMTLFEGRGVLLIQDEDPLPGGTTYTANVNPPSMIAGPYRAQREGSLVNSIDCDIIFVGGLYRVDGTSGNIKTNTAQLTFTYQQIDPITGAPIGGPSTIIRDWVSKKRGDLRVTVRSGVLTEGAYEVTVEWSAGWDDDNRKHSEPTWVALKGNIVLDTGAAAYQNTTMMAIRMKATNGLGGAATSRVRVKATRTLAAGNSNNPITVLKDIWTDTEYGMGRPLNELDLATMDPLEIEWDGTAGPRFNGSFDSRATGMESMQSVASMTGGKIVQDGGLTTIVFDGINLVRTALYTSGNIIQDSMQIIYTFDTDGDFDGVTVEYRDPQNFDALYYTFPVTATSPETYVLFGVTDTTYAQQFATYLWNVKSNRRKLCRFTTELEGLLPRFNDRIGVAHPMPAWAESGVVVEVIDDNTVQVDKYLNWTNNNIVIFRDEVGEPTNTLPVTKGGADNVLVFQDPIGTFVNGPEGIDPTNFVFGTQNNMVRDFILTKITPKSDTKVEIEAQTYTPTVYLGAPPHMGVLVCVGWDISTSFVKMEQIWRVASNASAYPTTIRRLVQANGLMVTKNRQIWQTEILDGGEWARNTLRYSDNFGDDWGAGEVERPYDAWWEEVDGSYNTKRNGSAYISMKLIGERLFANYFWPDNRQSLLVSTPGGRGAIDGQGNPWTPVHCSYSSSGSRTYTAAHAKVISHTYHFTESGGSAILIGGKSQETGGWHTVPGITGRVDGSEESTTSPPLGVGAKEYTTYNQYRVPPYDGYADNCYQIENNGFTFMGSGDDILWIYDPYTAPGGTLPEALNDTFWNGSQWDYNDQAGTAWREEAVGDYRRNSVLHDMGVADLSTRYGWTNDGFRICMPYKNIATDADPDFGKYYQFEYVLGDPGGISPQELDYSALLTSSEGTETNVATVRLFYDEKMARYLLVWSWFQSATGDGWPQRLYIRASHTTNPADFSDAVMVEHLDGWGNLLQLALRDSGGYALDYSKSEAKFTVSTGYLVNPGTYDQILCTFDDPFICNIWEPET